MDLAEYIRDIPDFPKPGIVFKDITPLLAEPRAFQEAIHQLCDHYQRSADRCRGGRRGPRVFVRRSDGAADKRAAHPLA